MTNGTTATLDKPLFILAFDHRSVLRALYGADLSDREASLMKAVVTNALIAASGERSGEEQFGLLIDEQTGAAEIPRAKSEGILVSVPIELSGAKVFTLETEDYLDRLSAIAPNHAKALVFLNPEGDEFESQLASLSAALSDVASAGHSVMLELVVPATAAQLASVDGDELRFDTEIRPALVVSVIAECYRRGMRPQLWKIEGLESAEAYESVASAIAERDPDARAIVLGRGAPEPRVAKWLELAARTPGFVGFAIGRSIWQEGLAELHAGRFTPEAASELIAGKFLHYCSVYRAASTANSRVLP